MADPVPPGDSGADRRRRLFDTLDEGVVVQDSDGEVRDWNAAALRMLRVTPDQLRSAADPVRALLRQALERGRLTVTIGAGGDAPRSIAISSHLFHDGGAGGDAIVSTMTDVTAQRAAEDESARYRELIDTLGASHRMVEEIPIGMCSVDLDGNVLRSNLAFLAIAGVETTSVLSLIPVEERPMLRHEFARLMEAPTPSVRIETRVRRPEGEERWCEITAVAMRQGMPDAAILLLIDDVTERRRRERRLRQLAERDPLTGLHNRRSFERALRERLSVLERAARRSDGDCTLLMIDLDGFKEVNDTCGHATGDAVLIAVAAAIRDRTRSDDTVGRLGGDEFAVLFCSEMADAVVIGEQIIERITHAASTVAGAPRVTASVGIVRLRPGRKAQEILEAADAAMYHAKRTGKARAVEAAV